MSNGAVQSWDGGCLCGAIRYRAVGEPIAQTICHCQTCRRAAGATPVGWATFRFDELSFLSGKPIYFRSSSTAVRSFCSQCGTPLTYQHNSSLDKIDITAATLDEPNHFVPTHEIWITDRVAWASLDPALPHCAKSSAQDL